jgi:phosphate:Na+ symporter
MNVLFIILFNFIVGSASLILRVNIMSSGLEKANPILIKNLLSKFTSKIRYAFITGIFITAALQSSPAVTAMTVGLVNAGLMTLTQTIGIIFGANIGTTITAQLMTFKITNLAIPIIITGLLVKFFSKKQTVKNVGLAVTGCGLMFIGLSILNSGVPYIKNSGFAYNLFKVYGKNPYIGLFIGMAATMLVHGSSATVGITIVLFNSGLITFDSAIGLMLGDNIGTCITAQVSSIGTDISAKRTAWSHTLYNIIQYNLFTLFETGSNKAARFYRFFIHRHHFLLCDFIFNVNNLDDLTKHKIICYIT